MAQPAPLFRTANEARWFLRGYYLFLASFLALSLGLPLLLAFTSSPPIGVALAPWVGAFIGASISSIINWRIRRRHLGRCLLIRPGELMELEMRLLSRQGFREARAIARGQGPPVA